MNRAFLVCLCLLGLSSVARAGGVVVPAEERHQPFTANLPACDDEGVIGNIVSKFDEKEANYWDSPRTVGDFHNIREIGFRANGVAYIPRRFCEAQVRTDDGKSRTAVYEIIENASIVGWSYGVEFCVVGLDRNIAYAPGCAVLRPFVERFLGEGPIRTRY